MGISLFMFGSTLALADSNSDGSYPIQHEYYYSQHMTQQEYQEKVDRLRQRQQERQLQEQQQQEYNRQVQQQQQQQLDQARRQGEAYGNDAIQRYNNRGY